MRKVFYTHDIITFSPLLLLTYKYTNRKERQIMTKAFKQICYLNKIIETYFKWYLKLGIKDIITILKIKTDKLHTVYYCHEVDTNNLLLQVTFNDNSCNVIKLELYIKSIVDNTYIKHDSKMFIISDNQVFEY